MSNYQNPSISIVIPVYNAETLIQRCVDSIFAQTYDDYEIVIVDDGSTDNSLQVCQNFIKSHNNVKVFHQENEGQTSARKYGFEQSKGKYIYFVDADDYVPENALYFLFQKIVEEDLDMIEGATISDFAGTVKTETFSIEGIFNKIEHLKMMYKGESHNGTHAILYRRNLFNENTFNIPYDVRTGEDFYLNLSLSLLANRIGLYNKVVYHYIENEQSITHIYKFKSIRPQEHLIECTRRELLRHNVFHLVKEEFYERAVSSIFIACLHNLSLRNDIYNKKIAKEALPHAKTSYNKLLCRLLLYPIFLPLLGAINDLRKYILKKMRR